MKKVPMRTWNLEDFLVSRKRKKPLQVTQTMLPESPEEKELVVAQLIV